MKEAAAEENLWKLPLPYVVVELCLIEYVVQIAITKGDGALWNYEQIIAELEFYPKYCSFYS